MTPKQIVKLRKDLGLTQQQLADMIGAQQPTVARWETGKNQPRGANLKALRKLKIESVPVSKSTREDFKKIGRELGRCLECNESWGDRSSAELLKRHDGCYEKWIAKWSKRPG